MSMTGYDSAPVANEGLSALFDGLRERMINFGVEWREIEAERYRRGVAVWIRSRCEANDLSWMLGWASTRTLARVLLTDDGLKIDYVWEAE
jgi:hypothetical protein